MAATVQGTSASAAAGRTIGTILLDELRHVAIAQDHAVESVLDMLMEGDAASQRDGLWILWKISQNENSRVEIRNLGGLEILVEWLSTDSIDIQKLSLRILCNMSFDDASCQEIRRLGGVGAILDCLGSTYSAKGDIEVIRVALRTLCNLSINESNKMEIRLQGGLETITECLRSEDLRTKRDALRTLCNLSIDPSNKVELGDSVPYVLDCLKILDPETQRYALASLINLTSDEVNEQLVRESGGLDEILHCAESSRDLDSRRFGVRCLCNMTLSDVNRVHLGKIGGIQVLLQLSKEKDLETRCYAMAALAHMCEDVSNCAAAGEQNGVSILMSCLQAPEAETRRYAVGALAVLASNEENRIRIVESSGTALILKCFSSRDYKTRRNATKCVYWFVENGYLLEQIQQHHLPVVAEFSKEEDPEVMRMAMEVLIACTESGGGVPLRAEIKSVIPGEYTALMSENMSTRSDAVAAFRRRAATLMEEHKRQQENLKERGRREHQQIADSLKEERKSRVPPRTGPPPSLASLRVRPQSGTERTPEQEEMRQQNKRLAEEVAELREKVSVLQQQLREKVSDRDTQIAALSSQLRDKDVIISRIQSESGNQNILQNELRAKDMEMSSLREKIGTLQEEVMRGKLSLRELESLNAEAKKKISELQEEVSKKPAFLPAPEPAPVATEFAPPVGDSQSDGKSEKLAKEVSLARKTVQRLQKELQESYVALQETQERERTGADKVRQLQRELEILQVHQSTAEQESQSVVASLEKGVSILREELGEASKASSLLRDLETQLREQGVQSDRLHRQIAQLSAERDSLLEVKEREMAALERIRTLERELRSVSDVNKQKEADLEVVKKEFEQSFQKMEQELQSSGVTQRTVDILQRKVESTTTFMDAQAKDIEALEEKLEAAQAELAMAEERQQASVAQVASLEAELRARERSAVLREEESRDVMMSMEDKVADLIRQLEASSADTKQVMELQSQMQSYKKHAEELRHMLSRVSEELKEKEGELADMCDRENTATARALQLQKELLFHEHAAKQLDAEKSSLESQVSGLGAAAESTQHLENAGKEMAEKLRQSQNRTRAVERELERLSKRLHDVEKERDELTEREYSAEQRVRQLQSEIELLHNANEQQRLEHADIQQQLHSTISQLSHGMEIADVVESLRQQVQTYTEELQRRRDENSELLQQLELSQEEILVVNDREHAASQRIAHLEEELRLREASLGKTEVRLDKLQSEVSDTTRSSLTERQEAVRLRNLVSEKDRKLEQLMFQVDRLHQQLEHNVLQLTAAEERERVSVEKIEELQRELDLQRDFSVMETRWREESLQELRQKLEEMENTPKEEDFSSLRNLQDRLESFENALRGKDAQINRLREELEHVQRLYRDMEEREETATKRKDATERELKLQQDLFVKELQEREKSIEELLQGLKELQEKCSAKEGSEMDHSAALVSLEKKVEALAGSCTASRAESESLRTELMRVTQTLDSCRESEKAATSRVHFLERELEKTREYGDERAREAENAERQLSQALQDLENQSAEKNVTQETVDSVKSMLQQKERKISEQKQLIETLSREMQHQRDRANVLAEREQTGSERVAAYQNELRLVQAEAQHVAATQAETIRRLETELRELEGTINETSVLESMLEEKEKELRRLQSLLAKQSLQSEQQHERSSADHSLSTQQVPDVAAEKIRHLERELELLQEENVRIVTCKDEEMSELDSLLNAIREEVKYCKLVEGSADDLAGTVRTIVDHCGHLEQQCQSLKDQLKKVDADLSASRQLEGDANRKTRQLQAEIDLLQRQADSEAAEKDLTMKQLTSQLEKLSHSVTSDSSSEVAASLQGMQDQMQSLSAKLHRVERSKELAEQELAAVKGEVVSLRELEAEASSKCLHLQSELDLVQRELRLVQGQVPEETQHELRQQLSEVTHLQSEVAAAEKRQQQEQEKVASLESVIRDLREENQRLTERLDLLAQQELAATDRVKLLQAELEQQSSTMSRSDAEIVSLQESLQILQNQIREGKSVQDSVQSLRDLFAEKEIALQHALGRCTLLQDQVKNADELFCRFREQESASAQKIVELTGELELVRQHSDCLEAELRNARSRLSVSAQRDTSSRVEEEEATVMQAQVVELQTTLQATRQSLLDREKELSGLRGSLVDKEEELASAGSTIQQLRTELQLLETENSQVGLAQRNVEGELQTLTYKLHADLEAANISREQLVQLEKRLAQESAQSSRHLAKAHQLEDALAAATLEKGVLEDVQKESSTAVQNLQHELDLLEKSSASERASSNAEKVQLQGRVDDLERELAAFRESNQSFAKAQQEISQLRRQLQHAESKVQSLENQVQNLERDLAEEKELDVQAQAKLAAMERELHLAQVERTSLSRERERTESTLSQRLGSLELELQHAQSESMTADQLRSQLSQVRSSLQSMQREVEVLQAECTRLRIELQSSQERESQGRDKVSQLERELSLLQQESTTLLGQREGTMQEMSSTISNLQSNAEDSEAARRSVSRLQDQLRDSQQHCQSLEGMLSSIRAEAASNKDQLQAAQAKISELESELHAVSANAQEELHVAQEEAQVAKSARSSSTEELSKEIRTLQDTLHESQRKLAFAEAKLRDKEVEYTEWRTLAKDKLESVEYELVLQTKGAAQESRRMLAQIADLRAQVADLTAQRALALEGHQQLMQEFSGVKTESESVQALRDTVSRLEDEKVSAAEAAAAAGAKVREVQAELENSVQFYKERVDQLQGKNRQLEEALDQQAQRYLSEMGVKTAQLEEVLQTEIQSALQERRNLEEELEKVRDLLKDAHQAHARDSRRAVESSGDAASKIQELEEELSQQSKHHDVEIFQLNDQLNRLELKYAELDVAHRIASEELQKLSVLSRSKSNFGGQTDISLSEEEDRMAMVPRSDFVESNKRILELQRELENVSAHADQTILSLESKLQTSEELREKAELQAQKLSDRLVELPVLERKVHLLEETNAKLLETSDLALGSAAKDKIRSVEEEMIQVTVHSEQELRAARDEALLYERKLSECERKLQSREMEIQDLRLNAKRFDKYSVDDIQRLLDEKEAADKKILSLERQILEFGTAPQKISGLEDELRRVASTSDAERAQLKGQISELQDKLDASEKQRTELARDLAHLNAISKMDQSRLEISLRSHAMQTQADADTKVESLKKELDQRALFAQEQMRSLELEMEGLLKELEHSSKYKEQHERMAEEVTRLQHLLQETVNRQLQARLGLERSSEERVSLLESELEKQTTFSNEQLAEERKRRKLVEAELQESQELLSRPVDRTAESQLQVQYQKTQARLDKCREDLEAAQQMVSTLRQEMSQNNRFHEEERAELQHKLRTLMKEKDVDERAVQFISVADHEQALEELKRREEHANGLVQTLERTVLDLKTSKKSLVEELDQCRDDLKAANKKIEELAAEILQVNKFGGTQTHNLALVNASVREDLEATKREYDERSKAWEVERAKLVERAQMQAEKSHDDLFSQQEMFREKIRTLEDELHQQAEYVEASREQQVQRHKAEVENVKAKMQIQIDELEAKLADMDGVHQSLLREKNILQEEVAQLSSSQRREVMKKLSFDERPVSAPNGAVVVDATPSRSALADKHPLPRKGSPAEAWSDPTAPLLPLPPVANLTSGQAVKRAVILIPRLRIDSDEVDLEDVLKQLYELSTKEVLVRKELRKITTLQEIVDLVLNQNPTVQRLSLRLLNVLSTDDGVEEEIRRAEGVEATVAALLRTSNRDVTIAALALLRSLSANSDIESLIVSLDVIPHLVSLVAQQEDQLLRRDATKTIRSLSFSNEAKIIVRNAGGIPVLLACLSEEDLEIRKSAMKAIMVLSINADNRVEIRTSDGIASIVEALRSPDFDIRRSAAGTLINLSVNARNKVEIRSCGGIPLLLHSLELEDEETKRYAIRTLSNLMINDENKAELLRHKGIPTIVSCLRSSDVVTVRFATKTLSAFCAHDTFCEEIMRVSALPSILQGVNSQDVETVKESLASIPPLLRFEETVKTIIKMNYVNRIVRLFLQHAPSRADNVKFVKAQLLAIVAELSSESSLRHEMVRLGVVRSLIEMLQSQEVETQINATVCLANLTSLEQAKEDIRQQGGIERLVAMMNAQLREDMDGLDADSTIILGEALRVVHQISTVDKNRVSFRRLGGLEMIMQCLASNDLSILRSAIRSIYVLSIDDEIEVEIARLGGLRQVLELLSFPDAEVQRRALAALCNLSISESNKRLVQELGGIQAVIQILGSTSDPKIRRDAVRAVRNLAFDDGSKRELVQLGALNLLSEALTVDDAQTVKFAIRALSILSIDKQIRGLIVDANGLPGVLRAMDSSDPETQRAAVGTLINVSINKRHKTLIRQQGGFDAILRCLNSSDSETIRYTLRALYNITLDEQNTLHWVTLGGVADLLRLLSVPDVDSQLYAISTLQNVASTGPGRRDMKNRSAIGVLLGHLEMQDSRVVAGVLKVLSAMASQEENLAAIRLEGGIPKTIAILNPTEDPAVLLQALKLAMLFATTASMEISSAGGIRPLILCSRCSDQSISKAATSVLHVLAASSDALRQEVARVTAEM